MSGLLKMNIKGNLEEDGSFLSPTTDILGQSEGGPGAASRYDSSFLPALEKHYATSLAHISF